jgi:hypothetical protein
MTSLGRCKSVVVLRVIVYGPFRPAVTGSIGLTTFETRAIFEECRLLGCCAVWFL